MLSTLAWAGFSFGVPKEGGTGIDAVHGFKSGLPFYKTVQLLKVVQGSDRLKPGYYLYYGSSCFALDGGAGAIYDANDYDRLEIDETNAIAYTLFFNEFILAEYGKFFIMEDDDDLEACGLGAKLGDEARAKVIRPRLAEKNADGGFIVEATALYATILANMVYEIRKDGRIKVVDAEQIWAEGQ